MVPVVTLLVLCMATGAILSFLNSHSTFKPITSYIVIVSHDDEQETVPTNEPTVGALLSKLNIALNKGDVVEPSASTVINQDNFRINVYRGSPVVIVDGSQKTFTFSAATTPRAVAQQAGLTVYPEDGVKFVPVTDFLTQGTIGQQVVIDRATPVNLNLYGTPTILRTHVKTIGQLLAEKNIKLAKGDTLQPASLATAITPNAQFFVIRNGTKIQTVTQSIPMPVQTVQDSSLTFGTTAIRQQGSAGQEVLTYQVVLQNGVSVGQTLIQTVVTVPPVTEIVAQGQAVQIPSDKEAVMAAAGISSSDYAYVNYIVSNESGWCPTKVQGEYGSCPGYAPPDGVSSYGGYGLGQATPGSKMSAFGSDWEVNPVTQLRWATSYADGRYGSWAAAYNHWYANHNW
jgi:uncharacterized protein YabE (DUF348 family)